MRITQKDYIKANKIANRELEKGIRYNPTAVHKSDKVYTRKLKHKKSNKSTSFQ